MRRAVVLSIEGRVMLLLEGVNALGQVDRECVRLTARERDASATVHLTLDDLRHAIDEFKASNLPPLSDAGREARKPVPPAVAMDTLHGTIQKNQDDPA